MNVIIYGRPNCAYCDKAKALCESKEINYTYHEVGVDISKEDLLEKIGKPVRSVPQVFIEDGGVERYIEGGFEGLSKEI